MKILAISGSLRVASINSAFCRAAVRLAPDPLKISVFTNLGNLPLFNPDLETNPPIPIKEFRSLVEGATALIIASPEYAHGISGVMKSALDWLVSFDGFIQKPVAIINTSSRSQHACASLKEILQTMSARVLPEASITIPLLGNCVTEEAMLTSPEVSERIRNGLAALASSLTGGSVPGPVFPLR